MEIWQEVDSRNWAEMNPARCPCRGHGWAVSDFDSVDPCHLHNAGDKFHPESDDFEGISEHVRLQYRKAFATFRAEALASGVRSARGFETLCRRRMDGDVTPAAWVNAAEAVAEEFAYAAKERAAKAKGYSCALEARWSSGDDY